MHKIFSDNALLNDGWHHNVTMCIENGFIASIESDTKRSSESEYYQTIVAGMPNLHSHAFQRAMAGFAERRGAVTDSFWSWRTEMYRLALSMTPQQVEAVASQLYMEMLEAGFTRVGEFHYLHHDVDGKHHADIGEMAARIASAAETTSIRLTLLPVFYAHAGFGGQSPIDDQKRFINSPDSFEKLLTSCAHHLKSLPGSKLGIAPHSLRAVTEDELKAILPMAKNGPVHIHISEQLKEVEDSIVWSGQRPVEWLLNHCDVDEKWCLIHATHMSEKETVDVAKSGAVAGLCPITEANLGDGTFNALPFMENCGIYGIGSDSNVCISVNEELRQLEYSLRLHNNIRNAVALPNQSNGRHLFDTVIAGGDRALSGNSILRKGAPADFVALDLKGQDWIKGDVILDSWIFVGNVDVDSVWVDGKKVVSQGRHHAHDAIKHNFHKTMQELFDH